MSLIKKANELEIPTNIKMMVYGQAGTGKSTYALSAPSPVLFDFDGGIKRIAKEHLEKVGIVPIVSWQDVLDVLSSEDLSPYQTIVIDTIGKMMDYIISYKCGLRTPAIKDWNGINTEFSNFIKRISALNKHIIFIAHRDMRKEGDETVFIPSLREKTYASIVTELDLLGYMEMRTENGITRRTITFDPTARNDGKNTCNLPSIMEISVIIDKSGKTLQENDIILRSVIVPYLSMLQLKKAEAGKYESVMKEIREQVELVTDEISANDFISRIDNFEHIGSSKAAASRLLHTKAISLGLSLNKNKKYERAA